MNELIQLKLTLHGASMDLESRLIIVSDSL